jgi:hypothetical protein
MQAKRSTMGRGDRCHNRKAEADTPVHRRPVGPKASERLTQILDLALIEERSITLHHQMGGYAIVCGCHFDEAARRIVADGVVDEVLYQAGQQGLASNHTSVAQGLPYLETPAGYGITASGERGGNELRQGHTREVSQRSLLRTGECEEALNEPVGLIEPLTEFACQGGDFWRHRAGLPNRDIK